MGAEESESDPIKERSLADPPEQMRKTRAGRDLPPRASTATSKAVAAALTTLHRLVGGGDGLRHGLAHLDVAPRTL